MIKSWDTKFVVKVLMKITFVINQQDGKLKNNFSKNLWYMFISFTKISTNKLLGIESYSRVP